MDWDGDCSESGQLGASMDDWIEPVHIASTVPTMNLYHTESKLDMRTLLVMNPQDLAEQCIGVEKFFENMKEVANSMRDRQRQVTVSDALCAKSVFDQQEDQQEEVHQSPICQTVYIYI